MIGNCIGIGSSCEVFEWDGDKVIKLFHLRTPLEFVHREYQNSLTVWKNGLPAPKPFEVVEWDGRPGIVFEKIVGETIINRLFEGLYSFNEDNRALQIFARVLYDIHKATGLNIVTNQKENLKAIIGKPPIFTDDEISAIHSYIDDLPEKQQLCHGDTNPSNLILIDDTPIMIDWMHTSLGNPAADIAEVCVMIEYAVLSSEIPAAVIEFFEASRTEACRIFIDEYSRLSGVTEEEIRSWYVPAAARSIASGAIPDEQVSNLAAMIRARICHG